MKYLFLLIIFVFLNQFSNSQTISNVRKSVSGSDVAISFTVDSVKKYPKLILNLFCKLKSNEYTQLEKAQCDYDSISGDGACVFDTTQIPDVFWGNCLNFEIRAKQLKPDSVIPTDTLSPTKILVNNVTDLVKSFKSNVTVYLQSGVYDLSSLSDSFYNEHFIRKRGSDYDPHFYGVNNFNIIGDRENKPKLVISKDCDILQFEASKNIRIVNVEAQYVRKKYFSYYSIFNFIDSKNILIENCLVSGNSSMGISLYNADSVICRNTNFDGSSTSLLFSLQSKHIQIENCAFASTDCNALINLTKTENIQFSNCRIFDNNTENLLKFTEVFQCMFNSCEIKSNTSKLFCSFKDGKDFSINNSTIQQNYFRRMFVWNSGTKKYKGTPKNSDIIELKNNKLDNSRL